PRTLRWQNESSLLPNRERQSGTRALLRYQPSGGASIREPSPRVPCGASGRKDIITIPAVVHRVHDLERTLGQRHAMLSPGLHPRSRHRPQGTVNVELLPTCSEDFTGSRGGEDRKFQSAGCRRLTSPQLGHEGRQISVVHRRMMTPREPLAL